MTEQRFLRTGERTWVEVSRVTHVVLIDAVTGRGHTEPAARVYLTSGADVEARGPYLAAVRALVEGLQIDAKDLEALAAVFAPPPA